MPHYEKYTTTVVGAHSVPHWSEALDRLVTVAPVSPAGFADAQYRAAETAILEQEVAGIDIVTDEMHRRTHDRHPPSNAMLNDFWHKIVSVQDETRPRRIATYGPNVFHPAATCEQTVIAGSCGFNHLRRHVAFGKLRAMAQKILRRQ